MDGIGLDRPVSKKLYELMKDYTAHHSAIADATNKIERLLPADDKHTEQYVYFKLQYLSLYLFKQQECEFTFSLFIIALTNGYFGQTRSLESRENSHRPSLSSLKTVHIRVHAFPRFCQFIETLIIKLINVDNFKVNVFSGNQFLVPDLSEEEHVLVALHYLKLGYEEFREIYEKSSINDFRPTSLSSLEDAASHSTFRTFSSQHSLGQPLEEDPAAAPFSTLEVGSLVTVVGDCTEASPTRRIQETHQLAFRFFLTSNLGDTLPVRCIGSAASVAKFIRVGNRYSVTGTIDEYVTRERTTNRSNLRRLRINVAKGSMIREIKVCFSANDSHFLI